MADNDEYQIEEDSDSSGDNIISSLAISSGKNRKPTKARINQTNKTLPVQKKSTKKDKSHFDNLPNGPVHLTVRNKQTPLTKEYTNVTTRREPKISPVIVDGADDEEEIRSLEDSRTEADALQANIDKKRKHSMKGYFDKVAHVVSNASTRKQKIPIEQGNTVKLQRSKSDEDVAINFSEIVKQVDEKDAKEKKENKAKQKANKETTDILLLERIKANDKDMQYRSPVLTRRRAKGASTTKKEAQVETINITSPRKSSKEDLWEQQQSYNINSSGTRTEDDPTFSPTKSSSVSLQRMPSFGINSYGNKTERASTISERRRSQSFVIPDDLSLRSEDPKLSQDIFNDDEDEKYESHYEKLDEIFNDNIEQELELGNIYRSSPKAKEMMDPNLEEEEEMEEELILTAVEMSPPKIDNCQIYEGGDYDDGVLLFGGGTATDRSDGYSKKSTSSHPSTDTYAKPNTSSNDDVLREQPVKVVSSISSISSLSPIRPSPIKPTILRSSRRKIEIKPFMDLGTTLQLEALSRDYEILPDLNRAGENDKIMFQVDSLFRNLTTPPTPSPPVASTDTRFWGVKGFVDLPWDTEYKTKDDIRLGLVIRRELGYAAEHGFNTFNEYLALVKRLRSFNNVDALLNYYKKINAEEDRKAFLELLHGIVKLANRAPELITAPLPILVTDENTMESSVSLSQEQCAALLACSFLGLFPGEKDFNHFILGSLTVLRGLAIFQKLRFVLNYFATVIDKMPCGVITFRRVSQKLEEMDIVNGDIYYNAWLCKVGLVEKCIEDCPRTLQVDFANKFIGGGVLGYGFVQEEIRFLCCPEMMVSMLLCPKMRENEAIFIAGAQQYSNYVEYGEKTQMRPLQEIVDEPRDKFRRIMCEVVAIDANDYHGMSDDFRQFMKCHIDREIRKAFIGFRTTVSEKPPVATGNWGCGAFRGNLQLKCIIQLIAATMAGRDIIYCVFDKESTIAEFCEIVKLLKEKRILLGELYQTLIKYRPRGELNLFDFLRRQVSR